MKDKVECFTFADVEIDISPENRSKLNVAKILATDPQAFRLVVIDNMPSHQRLMLKYCILNSWDRFKIPWASIDTSDFTDEVILSIKSGKPFNYHKFDDEYLIIDDIHHLLEKPCSQELFVKVILKRRLEAKKTTVLFCQYPISDMLALADDLKDLLKLGIKERWV